MIKIFICETTDCPNSGAAIALDTEAEVCVCGPCGNSITNIEILSEV